MWNDLENVDLHRHIIYQNDPMAKPNLMVMVPDLYHRRRRRQALRRLPSLPPEPQGHLENAFHVCRHNFLTFWEEGVVRPPPPPPPPDRGLNTYVTLLS